MSKYLAWPLIRRRAVTDYTATIPEELLAYIFAHVQIADRCARKPRDKSVPQPTRQALLGWIKITFVNRRWRRVAIDHVTLWTHLNGELGAEWVNEFVRRSKDAALSIWDEYFSSSTGTARRPSAHSYILTHHKRLKSLRLDAVYDTGVFLKISPCAFENLEDLSIQDWSTASADILDLVNSLMGHFPSLRSLRLHFASISWSALDFRSLRLDQLKSLNLNLDTRVSSATSPEFLYALRQMKALSELILFEIIVDKGKHPSTSCNHCDTTTLDPLVVYLESMRSMVVMSPTHTHAHLLRHIRLPSNARLALSNHASPSWTDQLVTHRHLAQGLRFFLQERNDTVLLHSAHIRAHAENRHPAPLIATIALTRAAQPIPPPIIEFHDSFHIDADTWTTGNDLTVSLLEEYASEVLSALPTDSIRALTMNNVRPSSARGFLSALRNVERLCIRVYKSQLKTHNLALLADPELVPMLRLVELHADDFDLRAVLRDLTDLGQNAVPTRFPVLEDVYIARQRMAAPFEAIYLHVAEEVALVKAGRTKETSCRGVRQKVMLESVRRLEKVRGVRIVNRNFSIFVD